MIPKPRTLLRVFLSFTILLAAVPALAQSKDVTGRYFFAERDETVTVEPGGFGGGTLTDPSLRLRISGGTVALQNVGPRRYRFVWHGDAVFLTFRPDSENRAETEIYLETP